MLNYVPLGDRLDQTSYAGEGWTALNALIQQHHDEMQVPATSKATA
jgi:hypothetical protein